MKASADGSLLAACRYALVHNLGLQREETVLVVTDAAIATTAELFYTAARGYSRQVRLIEIPVAGANGEEPPKTAAEEMLQADVILVVTSRSLSWTHARIAASKRGARIASMPNITAETILRTFPADYPSIRRRVNRICDLLDRAHEVQVVAPLRTDLVLRVEGRKGRGRRGGVYTEKGAWGNLPCGEAFVAPVEGTAEGIYVVDASHAGVGKLTEPIEITVRKGRAVNIAGGREARQLVEHLEATGNADAYNLAELGIGCNDQAVISGVILEDEKSLGTCHIGLGSNSDFGGTVHAGIHLDGVLRRPTILLDGQILIEQGQPRGPDFFGGRH